MGKSKTRALSARSTNFSSCIDDVALSKILSYHDDFKFVVLSCSLVSKQWMNIIKADSKLFLEHDTLYNVPSGDFLQTVETFVLKERFSNMDANQLYLENVTRHWQGDSSKIFSSMKRLTSLDLSHNLLDDQDLSRISQIEQLKHLDIRFNKKITLEGVRMISRMRQVTHLAINDSQISDVLDMEEVVECLSEMKQLTHLNLDSSTISKECAERLARLSQLSQLEVANGTLNGIHLSYISKMDNLTHLNINGSLKDVEDAKIISGMSHLTNLDIRLNRLDETAAKYIGEMKQLTRLDISNNKIGVEGAKFISELKNLVFLDIKANCFEKEDSIELFRGLTKITYLHFSYQNRIPYNMQVKFLPKETSVIIDKTRKKTNAEEGESSDDEDQEEDDNDEYDESEDYRPGDVSASQLEFEDSDLDSDLEPEDYSDDDVEE